MKQHHFLTVYKLDARLYQRCPLLPKTKGQGPITSTNHIHKIVQTCFDQAINNLSQDGYHEEAESLIEAKPIG